MENEILFKNPEAEDYTEEETTEGFVQDTVGGVVFLIIGMGVASMVMIFVGVLGGQTYSLTESDINAINNTTIKGYIQSAVSSSFLAIKQTGSYLPILVLAIMITVILGLIVGMSGRMQMGYGGYYGTAL